MLEAGSTVKAKVDSNGIYDLSLTADLSSQLSATFTTGGSASSILDGQTKAS